LQICCIQLTDETTLCNGDGYAKDDKGNFIHRSIVITQPGDIVIHRNGNLSDNSKDNLFHIKGPHATMLFILLELLDFHQDETTLNYGQGYTCIDAKCTYDKRVQVVQWLIVNAQQGDVKM
jgi:hypothetical protein